MAVRDHSPESIIPSFLRDTRVLQIIGQIIFVLIIVTVASQIMAQILAALSSRNLTPSFTFLNNRAGFDIAEHPDWYSSNSSYGEAYQVGIINTIRVVSVGLVATTFLGVVVGIFLLSSNWLLRTISRTYVELLRNVPLLVHLFIWYFIVMFTLPPIQNGIAVPPEGITPISLRLLLIIGLGLILRYYGRRLLPRATGRILVAIWAAASVLIYLAVPNAALRAETYPAIYISIRGFVFPELLPTARFADWLTFVALGVALAAIIWIYCGRITETTGRPIPRGRYVTFVLIGLIIAGWIIVGIEPTPDMVPVQQEDGTTVYLPLEEARQNPLFTLTDEVYYSRSPLVVVLPEQKRNRTGIITGFEAGNQISPEYMALLLGLVVYTSSFIAEIVRAGIRAVPYGQVEAARSLGMSTAQTLRMIILPQALRVIIPPLGNQYLNLTKNSSLAIALAYADIFQVTTTIMNQSGQAVTGILIVMVTYLIMSLSIASVTNWFNRQFQIVTR